MNVSAEEIAAIQPDYIILDEFHRCGAELWGRGVKNLLNTYPNVSILGLSATAIRYLDNQRNMTDELFDGNIASEMTLGEAIVRGIRKLLLEGGSVINGAFERENLIDEISLVIAPIVADKGGLPLFHESTLQEFELAECEKINQSVWLRYQKKGETA